MTDVFASLPKNHYGAILADPPWHFDVWAEGSSERKANGGPGWTPK